MTRSEMMLERDSYDCLSDFEDPAGRSFYSLDKSLTSNIGQGGATSSNFTKKPSIEANETLNKIIQSTGRMIQKACFSQSSKDAQMMELPISIGFGRELG
ncbi:unnamed protein product [Blepharisma stoltei]|uniref:Uncharacterized protein n=1 Tax=Blepharisma stoltei TaxID=1481888 RepID=A0AAU9JHM0_9CILI|nr:unnamed protein product [Blepharisma stoltei]